MEHPPGPAVDLISSPLGGMRGRGDWKRSLMRYGTYLSDTNPSPSVFCIQPKDELMADAKICIPVKDEPMADEKKYVRVKDELIRDEKISVQVKEEVRDCPKPLPNVRPKRDRAFLARLAKYECEEIEDDQEAVPVVVKKRKSSSRRASTSRNSEEAIPSFEMNDDGTIIVINGPADMKDRFEYQPKMARFINWRPRTPEEQARRDNMNAACRMSRARAKLGATRPYTYRKKPVKPTSIVKQDSEI